MIKRFLQPWAGLVAFIALIIWMIIYPFAFISYWFYTGKGEYEFDEMYSKILKWDWLQNVMNDEIKH